MQLEEILLYLKKLTTTSTCEKRGLDQFYHNPITEDKKRKSIYNRSEGFKIITIYRHAMKAIK